MPVFLSFKWSDGYANLLGILKIKQAHLCEDLAHGKKEESQVPSQCPFSSLSYHLGVVKVEVFKGIYHFPEAESWNKDQRVI